VRAGAERAQAIINLVNPGDAVLVDSPVYA
jgi:hypothetical protein